MTNVSRTVPTKSTTPALEGIKVRVEPGCVELTAYNLEMGIRTTISADTDDSGAFVLNARLFSEFTKRMSGNRIEVTIDENNVVQLSSDAADCTFSAISAEEYPDLPVVDSKRSFSVKQSTLRSMINMTSYAAAQNENKPIFTGELFDIDEGMFTLVAIDGFRLAIRTEPTDTNEKFNFVVPKKALQEISTIIKDDSENDCIISVSERHIIFELNNFFVISRLLEGAFHNYRRSIPESYKTEVFVNKKDFIGSLERCSLIIDDKNKSPIRCEVNGGTMKISCRTAVGRVNDAISADITGDSVTIGFNHRLMLDALKAAEGDKVRIRFNGSIKVIEILPPEGENYIFLVMPIQLKG
ncbi:MAG: DNA polymerase III subunit beta [Ruminococcus sp.]|nr:DNA polymerase III subunit beta [Ruminococcus sp.]